MAAPTIPNGKEHFFTTLYEGNGAGQRVGQFVPFTDNGTIANSVIFNRADNPYMHFNKSGITPDSDKIFTFSCWFKFGELGSVNNTGLFNSNTDGSNGGNVTRYAPLAIFYSSNTIFGYDYDSGGYNWYYAMNRTFEDTSKWYHFVIAFDTTQSTDTNRMKIYIDGEQITSFSSITYPALNQDLYNVMAGGYHILGLGYNAKFDGYLAEVNLIENQMLTPASFGITDTSTGRWIPKTVSPFPTTTTDIAVTVVSSGGNKFAVDGVTQGAVTLIEGATYKFDQSDSSNATHPLRFSTTSDGTHNSGTEYTTGVTTVGTPGSSGAYTQITVATGAPTLYYYCSSHSGMGGTANTQDQYGTNGFRLKFQDSSALGDDTSGNTNDFSVTNIVAGDQTTDSPTQNFSTLEGSSSGSMTLSEGNLRYTTASSSNWESVYNDKSISSGKWYFELTCKVTTAYDVQPGVILESLLSTNKNQLMGYTDGSVGYNMDGAANTLYYGNSGNNYVQTTGTQVDAGDIVGVAYDADTGAMWFAKNNTWVSNGTGVGNPSTGANPTWVQGSFAGQRVRFGFSTYNASASSEINFGQKSFTYTPPTDFKKLQQDNLPETAKGITGLNWIKDRDNGSYYHTWQDSSRGPNKEIYSNDTSQQASTNDSVTKFLKGGVAVEDAVNVNNSGDSFVSWNWVGNSGTTSTNTDGNVTCTLQVNDNSKFSIQTWTNTGAGTKTIGHGLGVKPGLVIQKRLDTTSNWFTYHHKLSGNGSYLHLNNIDQIQTGSDFANTEPTTSVFSSNASSSSSATFVSYCFAEVEGFSKFGHYIGNGVADGPFVYTGFKPAFIIFKATAQSTNWYMHDAARSPINPAKALLDANSTAAESSSYVSDGVDFLSNGFKVRQPTGYGYNYTSQIVYIAFAEHPFVGDGTNPVTAR